MSAEEFNLHIVIVANGWLTKPLVLQPGDLLLAADGGARNCLEAGLTPDTVIGDLDSLDEPILEALASAGTKILRFPSRKDYTDLELAIQHAVELGAESITLVAALGARWDQTFANVLLAASNPGIQIKILDGNQEISFLRSGENIQISGQAGDTVSLISLSAQAKGIRTENLEYPLQDETLRFGSTRGVSNTLLQSPASVFLENGLLMVTMIHHKESSLYS